MARQARKYRPEPVIIGNLRARVVRGPHKDDGPVPQDERRWYWRVFRGEEEIGILGWVAPIDVARLAAERFTVSGDSTATPKATFAGTVGALIDAFVAYTEARQDIRKSSTATTRNKLANVRNLIGDVRVGAVTADILRDYANQRVHAGAASGTIIVEIKKLRSAWRWGSSHGRSFAPLRALPMLRIEHRPMRSKYTPPDSDIEATIDAAPWTWPRVWLTIAYQTGARSHEIAVLHWANVDLEGDVDAPGYIGIPDVPDEDRGTKTGARRIAIDTELVDALMKWAAVSGADVKTEDSLLGVKRHSVTSKLGGILNGLTEDAGVFRFTPHAVRRAVVRRFRRAKVPVGVAAAYFGHSVAVMIEMYDEVSDEDHADALALVRALRTGKKAKTRAKRDA